MAKSKDLPLHTVRRLLRRPISWAVLLTIVYLAALVTQATPYLLGNAEWRWHGRPPGQGVRQRCWPALTLLAAYLLLCINWIEGPGADRPSPSREWGVLGLLILVAPAIQVALRYMRYPYPVEFYLYRSIGSHNGFWQTAVSIDSLSSYLGTYPQQMRTTEYVHLATHPPGDVLYVWLWRKALEVLPGMGHTVAQYFRTYNCSALWFVQLEDAQIASALGQMTIPLLSGLCVVPLYLLGKRVSSSRAGFRAAALYIIVPSLTLFTIRWDQLYPLFLCLSLYWLHIGLEDRRSRFFFLAGLSSSVASFMSFGNLTIVLALGAYGFAHMVSLRWIYWRKWLRQTWSGWALLALGTTSTWLVYQIAYGVSFWDVFSTAMQSHLHLGRSYRLWVGWNLYDFLSFLGVPIAVLFVVESGRAWRSMATGITDTRHERRLGVAISAALLVVNVLGVVRGEVGRIWLLWMPIACLIAAIHLTRQDRRFQFALILSLVAVQTLFFTFFVRVDATGMRRFEPRDPNMTPPAVDKRLRAQFGDEIALVGYELESSEVAPGEKVRLTLYWQALKQPELPYTVFMHVVDEEGELRGQQDNMPVRGKLPTTCWRPGEFVTDPYTIPVSSDISSGQYSLEVGLYYLPSGERLPVTAKSDHASGSLSLTSVQVRPVAAP